MRSNCFSVNMLGEFFHFRCVCRAFFLNYLTPPLKGKLMPRHLKLSEDLKISF